MFLIMVISLCPCSHRIFFFCPPYYSYINTSIYIVFCEVSCRRAQTHNTHSSLSLLVRNKKMALTSAIVLCFSALFIAFTVLVPFPELAMASGRGYFYLTDTPSADIEGQSAGLCASAITIHGYPCQEFVVSSFSVIILN